MDKVAVSFSLIQHFILSSRAQTLSGYQAVTVEENSWNVLKKDNSTLQGKGPISAAIYCSIICTKSATCNAFYYDASNCYETRHGKSLLAAWEGSVNVKSVYVAQGVAVEPASLVPNGFEVTWYDDFNGNDINRTNWVVGSTRDPDSGDMIPGAAGDHLLSTSNDGYIVESDSYIWKGYLMLRSQKRPRTGTSPPGQYNYTSGMVMSMHRVHFNKGFLEMRAQLPKGDKVSPAFRLLSENLVWCPEWYISYWGHNSLVSPANDTLDTGLCHGQNPDQKWEKSRISNFDSVHKADGWHRYGFEWTSEKARWFLDGKVIYKLTKSSLGADQGRWPNENMYILLTNKLQAAAPDSTTSWPNNFKIDYIRLYKWVG